MASLWDWSGSSDSDLSDENAVDLSHSEIDELPDSLLTDPLCWKSVQLSHNSFVRLPKGLGTFLNLVNIDISNNGLTSIGAEIECLQKLEILTARNNLLDSSSLPKDFGTIKTLETINFSGNRFTELPMQLTELKLKTLYLGANRISAIPSAVKKMQRLVSIKKICCNNYWHQAVLYLPKVAKHFCCCCCFFYYSVDFYKHVFSAKLK